MYKTSATIQNSQDSIFFSARNIMAIVVNPVVIPSNIGSFPPDRKERKYQRKQNTTKSLINIKYLTELNSSLNSDIFLVDSFFHVIHPYIDWITKKDCNTMLEVAS